MAILGVLEHSLVPVSTKKLHLGQPAIYVQDSQIRNSKNGSLEQFLRKTLKISQTMTKESSNKSGLALDQKQKLG